MKKKVIILGGGVAGMSAAHELIERGFEVEVYEKQHEYVGGKARSVNVPHTNTQHPDKYLPGEHGFRFFPGFYKHVVDTMRRTPQSISNGVPSKKSCFDNLEDTETIMITKYGDSEPIVFPTNFFKNWASLKMLYKLFKNRNALLGLKPGEGVFFGKKMLQLMCSCEDRRNLEYENESWWDYTEAGSKSDQYQKLLAIGVTRTLVAADAHKASTKTDGNIILQLLFNFADPTIRTDRLFNAPTNEAWLDPWYRYLLSNGVKYHKNSLVEAIEMDDEGKVSGAEILDLGTKEKIKVTGDYYILAVPANIAAHLFNEKIREADPSLANLDAVVKNMSWMSGMQFYLNQSVKINPGHVNYAYTEWALTSIDQMSFWKNYELSDRYNGKVKSILSIDISNWLDADGNYPPADEEDIEEIKEGVWQQLEKSLNKDGNKVLDASMIEYYYLDNDIVLYPNRHDPHRHDPGQAKHLSKNREMMIVNTKGSWKDRPEATTNIPNLFLASDYVRTYTDLATMEAANEAARRAVNGILSASGSDAAPCEIWKLKEPALFSPLKWYDKRRFQKKLPFSFGYPIWIKLGMVLWGITYLGYTTLRILIFKLLGLKPQ